MTTPTTLTFVRHTDGLRYDFTRSGTRHGRPAYERTDGRVGCLWSPSEGWHCESADGIISAYPVTGHHDAPEPPATVWRSFKADRSHLYDLLHQ
ncbi:hypothetical protein [Streptomyces tagetis]|uniref:Uncharacterized protein n=1 Tax=Streptomyces tagetis TaxID=2820809 RepID=A0A940XRH5_9ACTN|nr:hypothetical protein [Streptomyces sp. RG38]MBQ0828398.1 hypothetical protein [Streptomyces sp. RG38]